MIVDNFITLGFDELNRRRWERTLKKLTFINGQNEIIQCFQQLYTRGEVRLPRGAWELVDDLDYRDHRVKPLMPSLEFTLKLDDVEKDERFKGQSDAVNAMFANEQGQIIRPPGTGKTQIALKFIAECETTTLVIVHTEDILKQWEEYAADAIPGIDIGIVRGKRAEIGHLTIATVQTLRNHVVGKKRAWWEQFGCVIADEAHHGAAPSWDSVVNKCPAFYRFGFTASRTRADGMHPALRWIFGKVIHEQKFSSPVELSVKPVRTKFYFPYRGQWSWTPMINALTTDERRNRQIANIINKETARGNSILVLSRRIEHLGNIQQWVNGRSEVLTGARKTNERKEILSQFRSGELPCLLATQLADEALDVPRLSRVILTHPGKHEGRIVQQIGRAIRTFPDKKDAIIYDMVDWRVGVLRRQYAQRRRTYHQLKISIRKRRRVGY
jgi:superfamily II DNA or RNA helicase